MQTVKFFTLGCKVNQYETQAIREQFLKAGFTELNDQLPADVCVINTCTVTHRADADSLNFIRRAKRENPSAQLIVTGCLAELDEERIKKAVARSLIVKNKCKGRITESLFSDLPQLRESKTPSAITGISGFKAHTRVFLKIQDGCNNFCSYCKVPLVRGRSRSRALKEIINEATNLVRNGFKEIVLCGICLGAYGKDLIPQSDLVYVIEALEKIDGLLRIRLSSIEAKDVSCALIEKMAISRKLCRHLHIPLQSGNDRILKRMNRNYNSLGYLELIQKIKEKVSLFALTTDVLVGFPEEDESAFEDTLGLIRDILPLKAHIFPYSARRGTAASNFKDIVKPSVIKSRILRLGGVADKCAATYKKQFLGSRMDVLIEGRLKKCPDFCWGYTENYLKVMAKSKRDLSNHLLTFKLKKIYKEYISA